MSVISSPGASRFCREPLSSWYSDRRVPRSTTHSLSPAGAPPSTAGVGSNETAEISRQLKFEGSSRCAWVSYTQHVPCM